MSAGEVISNYVAPSLGTILAVIMFQSSRIAVSKVRETGELGTLNPLPYPVIVMNCLLWIGYGSTKKDWFMLCANFPGLLLGLWYSTVSYGAARGSQKTLLEGFLLMSVGVPALIAWMAVVVVGGSRDSVLGASALTVTIAYYGVPLSSMREVVRTRDASSILYPLTVTNTINASCWFVYGLFALHDPVVWAPNGVGVLLGMVQFTLRIIYGTQSAEVQILGQSSIKNVEDGSVSVLRETA